MANGQKTEQNLLTETWFWFSQSAAILSLINIWADAVAWAEFVRWAVSVAPDWVGVSLSVFAQVLDAVAWPMRRLAQIIFDLIGLAWPEWVFSICVLVSLLLLGALRSFLLRIRHRLLMSQRFGKQTASSKTEDVTLKLPKVYDQLEAVRAVRASYTLVSINRMVLWVTVALAVTLLLADFVYWIIL